MASRLIDSTPFKDGFVMPAEYEPQEAVWIMIGGLYSHWHSGGYAIRDTQVKLAKAILEAGTKVNIAVPQNLYMEVEYIFRELDVSIYEMTLDNCWPRDSGAITVKNRETGEVRGVDFKFTAWGGELHGAQVCWANDDLAARKMLQITNLDRYKTTFTLEGGSITTDGEGTVITTESCLLNENRNPHLDRAGIEETLKQYLGFEKVIWLKRGIDLGEGETDGHIDDICAFIGPAEVVTCYTEDTTNEYYEIFKECYDALCNATDAKGRKLKVHKLTAAKPFRFTKAEAENVLVSQGVGREPDGKWRKEGDFSVPSYANFLITNGSIIFPIYGLETDEEAIECITKIVDGRYVIRPVNAHEIALNGGSIHCFTQQVSK